MGGTLKQARSSVGERLSDAEEVGGSKPPAPPGALAFCGPRRRRAATRARELMADSVEERHLKLTGEFDCDATPLATLRHSTSHVMAQAVKRLWPDVKVAIGPAIEDGFYYDFAKAEPFTPEDLEKIEGVMREIIKADTPFERTEMSRADAIAFFRDRGETY